MSPDSVYAEKPLVMQAPKQLMHGSVDLNADIYMKTDTATQVADYSQNPFKKNESTFTDCPEPEVAQQ